MDYKRINADTTNPFTSDYDPFGICEKAKRYEGVNQTYQDKSEATRAQGARKDSRH